MDRNWTGRNEKALKVSKEKILIGWTLSKSLVSVLLVSNNYIGATHKNDSGTFGVIGSCVMFVILGSNKNTVGSVLMRNFAFSNMLFSLSLPVWLIESYNRKVTLYIISLSMNMARSSMLRAYHSMSYFRTVSGTRNSIHNIRLIDFNDNFLTSFSKN